MGSLAALDSVPCRVTVVELVSSRYNGGVRPDSWDERVAGIDTVRTVDGRVIRLLSDGGQNPPQPGWVLLVRGGDHQAGYVWTLYGLPKGANLTQACIS